MEVYDDYLRLLDQYGLRPPPPLPSGKEGLAFLREALESPDEVTRAIAQRALDAVSYFETVDPGIVNRQLAAKVAAKEHPFPNAVDSEVDLVQKILKIQGVDLPMEVYFGTFPTNDFNANARRTANGALCLLNQGLTAFLYHFSVACCYPIETTAAAGKGATVRIPERFLYSEMPKLQEAFGGALLTAYYYLTRSQHEYPTTFSDSYDPFGFATANLLTYAMRAFVVAHELSHVLLGHVDDSAASVRSAVTPVGEVTVLSRNQQQEFEADVMAQRILMAADRLLPNSGLYASGGICFLATHLFVQQLAAKMFDVPFDERSPTNSHPPARDRISNLLGRLREEADKDVYARSFQLFRLLIKYSSELGRAEVAALHSGEGVKLSFKIPPDEDK